MNNIAVQVYNSCCGELLSALSIYTTKILKPTNGGYAAADADLSVSLAVGVGGAWVETAKYANQDGTITCTGSTDVKAVVIYN